MLAIKVVLVPLFLFLLSVASKRWGASIAGWLAGLPVVAGPILFFLCWDHGPAFASKAASASLCAVFASVCFSLAYAHAAQKMSWPMSLFFGLTSWSVAVVVLSLVPPLTALGLGISTVSLVLAPQLFPAVVYPSNSRHPTNAEIGVRMLTGAVLTIAVTAVAGTIGQTWSGLLAVFPVIGTVLAVFSHASQGAAFAATVLRSMTMGLYSFAAFCLLLSTTLTHAGVAGSFLIAVAGALLVQTVTRHFLVLQSSELDSADARAAQ